MFPKEFMPSTSSLSDKRTLQIGLLDLYPNYWCKDLSISQLTVEQESDEITIMVAFLDEKDNAEVNQIEDTESFSNIWDHYELEVLRFVNCKPLGNRYSNPLELSCDLIQSIRSFQWKNFCFKVGSIFLEEYCKIFLQPIESRFQHNHMHICPRKHKVVLGIHLQSNQGNVNYCSLIKNFNQPMLLLSSIFRFSQRLYSRTYFISQRSNQTRYALSF